MAQLIYDSPELQRAIQKAGADTKDQVQILNAEIRTLDEKVAELGRERKELLGALTKILISCDDDKQAGFLREEFEGQINQIKIELQKLEQRLFDARAELANLASTTFSWKEIARHAQKIQEVMLIKDPAALKTAYQSLFEVIIVGPEDSEGYRTITYVLNDQKTNPAISVERRVCKGFEMVDQPEYGTNTSYLIDFIKICLSPKLASSEEIRALYVEQGLSAAQIASQLRVAKSFVLARLHGLGIRSAEKPKRYTDPQNYRCPIPPFGYSASHGKLIPNKAELRVCHAIVELIARKGLSSTATAKELSRRGLKNRAGSSNWSHGSVLAIYRRWKEKL